eukprot:6823154-Prymnesium_polylepis.1
MSSALCAAEGRSVGPTRVGIGLGRRVGSVGREYVGNADNEINFAPPPVRVVAPSGLGSRGLEEGPRPPRR